MANTFYFIFEYDYVHIFNTATVFYIFLNIYKNPLKISNTYDNV